MNSQLCAFLKPMFLKDFFQKIILLLCFFCSISTVSAQSISPPIKVLFFVETPITTQFNFASNGTIDSTVATHQGCVYVELADTSASNTTIDNLHINLGTSVGGSELFSGIFDFQNATPLAANQSIGRVGLKMVIRTGLYSLLDLTSGDLYLEVKLEDSNHVLTTQTSFTYSNN